jgi:hypothetical protein
VDCTLIIPLCGDSRKRTEESIGRFRPINYLTPENFSVTRNLCTLHDVSVITEESLIVLIENELNFKKREKRISNLSVFIMELTAWENIKTFSKQFRI